MHRTLLLCLFITFSLTACAEKPDQAAIDSLVKRTLENMVFIEGGSFMMGDRGGPFVDIHGQPDNWDRWTGSRDDDFVHKVTLDGFYISRYEVTFSEFDLYTTANGLPLYDKSRIGSRWREPDVAVSGVTWYQASGYCKWLGEVTGLPFDLPTEAQWEYVARSKGTRNDLWPTNDGTWRHKVNVGKGGLPLEPGRYPPNPLGIYDLAGNAMEWVRDWYDWYDWDEQPQDEEFMNPAGPPKGVVKVWRGGGGIVPYRMNTVRRGARKPDKGGDFQGIRCVINTDKPLPVTPRPVTHRPDPVGRVDPNAPR